MFGNLGNQLNELMKDAEEMKKEMEKIEVIGESGAGAVKATMTAKHKIKKLHIDDEILKEDKVIIEDLVAAAVNDAASKIEAATKDKMMGASNIFESMMSGNDNKDEKDS